MVVQLDTFPRMIDAVRMLCRVDPELRSLLRMEHCCHDWVVFRFNCRDPGASVKRWGRCDVPEGRETCVRLEIFKRNGVSVVIVSIVSFREQICTAKALEHACLCRIHQEIERKTHTKCWYVLNNIPSSFSRIYGKELKSKACSPSRVKLSGIIVLFNLIKDKPSFINIVEPSTTWIQHSIKMLKFL